MHRRVGAPGAERCKKETAVSKAIVKFFRSVPVKSLRAYFEAYPCDVVLTVDWDDAPKNIVKFLRRALSGILPEDFAKLQENAERINEMTDEIGQTALLSVVPDAELEAHRACKNAHDRALRIFLTDKNLFRRAEEIRHTDRYRKGRMWSAFVGPKNVTVSTASEDMAQFEAKILACFRAGQRIKVDIFDRTKPYGEDQDLALVQVVAYHERLPESYPALDEANDVISKVYRPAHEIALTYEPESGSIEVIANDRECRPEIAKLFAETLLQTEIEGQKFPLKQYDIAKLLRPFDFPTDPQDGIQSVKVTMLRLTPYDSQNKVTLDASAREPRTLYALAQEWFNAHDPLRTGFALSGVRIAVKFAPDHKDPRGKTVTFKIGYPNSCDLKDKTEKERLIGEKYLRRWGLIKDV
jgi:hypothetical protein